MANGKPKGPVTVWVLNYFSNKPEPEEVYVLEGAWFRPRTDKAGIINSYDVIRETVFLSEEDGLRAGISRCEVEMNDKIRALQENIVEMRNRLDTLSGDGV